MKRLGILLMLLVYLFTTQLSVHAFAMHDMTITHDTIGCHYGDTEGGHHTSLCLIQAKIVATTPVLWAVSYDHMISPCLMQVGQYDRISDVVDRVIGVNYYNSGPPPGNFLFSLGALGHGVKMHC